MRQPEFTCERDSAILGALRFGAESQEQKPTACLA
jgi:hypothetical protein